MYRNLPPRVVRLIEDLIDASYSGRDELYAASHVLDDERKSNVCNNLARHLAGHASELQQQLIASDYDAIEPLDMLSIAESFLKDVKQRDGDAGVLSVAEKCERIVKQRFDDAIDVIDAMDGSHNEATEMLLRQRDDIEFGEDVLHSMRRSLNTSRPDGL